MPAPKNPQTAAATDASVAARSRAKFERMAAELRAIGAEVTMPWSSKRTGDHVFQVETRAGTGRPWVLDRYGSKEPVWFTLAGAGLRTNELEVRGIAARLTN